MAFWMEPRQQNSAARSPAVSIGAVALAVLGGSLLIASCMMPQDAALPVPADRRGPAGIEFSGRVTSTVDGDTFRISSQNASIRIWGLDAPETDQPGGSVATSTLTRLISGKTLRCRQRDMDRYGRIVGQCFLPDGRDITAAMIESGTAVEYCRFSGDHYGTCRTASLQPPNDVRISSGISRS